MDEAVLADIDTDVGRRGKTVEIGNFDTYWQPRFDGARRLSY